MENAKTKPHLRPLWQNSVILLILFLGIFCCVQTLWLTWKDNNGFGFPLDDSWIHLQFARNLHEYGVFSYYKGEMITAGSTSPLYTCILAIGFFFTSNEMLLSYFLGIGSLLLAAFMMYKLASLFFDHHVILAPAAALLLVLEPRLQWIALAGMETTLFLALLLVVLYFYSLKKPIPLGITGGLLLWTRPEAVILFIVLGLDALYRTKFVKQSIHKKHQQDSPTPDISWIKKGIPYAFALVAAYIMFNMVLSGSMLPNTYAAKLKYYSNPENNFPNEVFHFLTDAHFFIPAMFAMISTIVVIWSLIKRRSVLMLIPFLWSLLLFVAYWKNLPKLYQNGRYLMPLLPCFLLLSLDGMRRVLNFLKQYIRILTKPRTVLVVMALVVLVLALQFAERTFREETTYRDSCRYITDRQVKTALWIRDHSPQDAVVATHDIGAIAYYSQRRIVDMVGLVSPDMINNIGRFDLLMKFLIQHKTTHVATLRNWFEIVNTRALFQTDPAHPEIMEVFQFDPGHTHFTSQEATRLNDAGEYYLLLGNVSTALQIFRQSFLLDPQSARTNFLIGKAARSLGDLKTAEERFTIVRQLQPDYPKIAEQMADVEKAKNR
jgi:tetratricopeptide (TPR) repeat protein